MPNSIRKDILQHWDVLVVDEPDSLDVARRILKFYGATVHTATNGQEGLSMVRQVRPRFVISDLSMPVMDGWEMLSALKQDRTTIDIPVIALTAHAMIGDRERAIAAGFHNHLTKPLTAATFMGNLLTVLDEIPAFAAALTRES
jgi:CheY-like chemotaxis protein